MKNLLTNILSGRHWLVVGAALIATFLLVVSAWGIQGPRHSEKATPPHPCMVAGVLHREAHCATYNAGFLAGFKRAVKQAPFVVRPTGKISLYVESTVHSADRVGAAFVYYLRSDIAESPLYSLAPDASSADFTLMVVTDPPDAGSNTGGGITIVADGPRVAAPNFQGEFVSSFAFVFGKYTVREGAKEMLFAIDHTLTALPAL